MSQTTVRVTQTAPQRMNQDTPAQKKIILIYGPPNAYKTRTLATAPSPIILETEPSGLMSLKGSNVLYWDCVAKDPKSVLDNLRLAWAWIQNNGPKEEVKTICIDSITSLYGYCMDTLLKGDQVPSKKEFGEANRQCQVAVDAFISKLDQDVVITAGFRFYEDEASHREYTSPDITPGLMRWLTRIATDGFYFTPPPIQLREMPGPNGTKIPVTHVANIGADNRYWTKTRSVLPSVIPNPNLSTIFQLIEGRR